MTTAIMKRFIVIVLLTVILSNCSSTGETIHATQVQIDIETTDTVLLTPAITSSSEPTATPMPTKTTIPSPTPVPSFSFEQINRDGFGNPMNSVAGALESFNGMLYVGTRNVEDGAEIWRYDGKTWEQTMADGFGSDIEMINDFIEFKDYLYAGTWAMRFPDDENIMAVEKGGEVWRSADGKNWEKVVENGFNQGPIQAEVIRFYVYKDKLFTATWSWDPDPTFNGATLWFSETGDKNDWFPVTVDGFDNYDNKAFLTEEYYQDSIYIGAYGTWFPGWSARIYRSTDGLSWDQVPNISDEWDGYAVSALEAYNSSLYAAVLFLEPDPSLDDSSDFYTRPRDGKVFKCSICDGTDWELAFGGPYDYPNMGRKMALFNYADSLFMVIGNDDHGLEIWKTNDGDAWNKFASHGMNDKNNVRLYWDNGHTLFKGSYFLGVSNLETGTEIWMISVE